MQVKSILSILSTFNKLLFVLKTFVLSIFEWPLKTGFTVQHISFPEYCFRSPEQCSRRAIVLTLVLASVSPNFNV